jgi:hypothetical protein
MNFSSEVCHRNLFMDKELIMKARLRIFTLLCFFATSDCRLRPGTDDRDHRSSPGQVGPENG